MAESAGIKRVSIKHEAIIDFLIANPTMRLRDVAAHFGVTQPWLSCIIHSDAFQTLLREKQGVVFHHTVLPIREKMMNIGHMALDKLAEQLPMETDTRTIANVAESVLDRLGFGTKGAVVNINNTVQNTQVNVLRDELEAARALIGKTERPRLEVVIDGERTGVALPVPSQTDLGASNSGKALAVSPFRAEGGAGKEGS